MVEDGTDETNMLCGLLLFLQYLCLNGEKGYLKVGQTSVFRLRSLEKVWEAFSSIEEGELLKIGSDL